MSSDERTLLAIDLGTSGPKVALFTADCQTVVGSEVEVTRLLLEPGGGAEQDPEDWWRAVIVRRAMGHAGIVQGYRYICRRKFVSFVPGRFRRCEKARTPGEQPRRDPGLLTSARYWIRTSGLRLRRPKLASRLEQGGSRVSPQESSEEVADERHGVRAGLHGRVPQCARLNARSTGPTFIPGTRRRR